MRTGAQVSSKASIQGHSLLRTQADNCEDKSQGGIHSLPEACLLIHGLAGPWVFPGTGRADP